MEFLKRRRWFRRLCTFSKIKTYHTLLSTTTTQRNSFIEYLQLKRHTTFQSRTKTFKFSLLPWSIVEWNQLDLKIRNSSYLVFRNYVIKRIRQLAAPVYNIHNHPLGLKLLTRLRLGLSHLSEHRFNHNFERCLNLLCTCSLEVKSTTHFFV